MASALRELIAIFGVEVDDKKLDHMGEKLEGTNKLLEKVGASIGLAFGLHEIADFIGEQIELAAHIGNTAEILGVATDELQEFRYAALNADVEADAADKSLRFLNKNLGEAVAGNQEASQTFRDLGIDLESVKNGSRNATSLLPDIADKFEGITSQAERTALAMKIFGKQGASLLPLLQKGGKELEKYRDEFEELGGGISEELIHQAEEGEHAIKKFRTTLTGLKATVAGALIPAFTWLADVVGKGVAWFREFSKHSYIVQSAMAVMAVAVGALALVWAVLNFEIFLVVIAIALLILAADDIYTAFKGGQSAVGELIDSLFGVGATQAIVQALSDAAIRLWEDLGDVWTSAKALVSALASLDDQSSTTKGGIDLITGSIRLLTDGMHASLYTISLLIHDLTYLINLWSDFKKEHAGIANGLTRLVTSNPAGGSLQASYEAISSAQSALGATHVPGSNAYAAGLEREHGPITNHTTVNVDVATTGSPNEAGKAVANGVRDGIDQSDLQNAYAGLPGGGGT